MKISTTILSKQDVYYFFDEIQYAQDWDKWLKAIYDMQTDTKMVATGSASPVLVNGSQESVVPEHHTPLFTL